MNRDLLFFSKTYNFLNDYIPKQQNGTECTLSTYKQGLKSWVSDFFGVLECTNIGQTEL